jgi:hypothetical protein
LGCILAGLYPSVYGVHLSTLCRFAYCHRGNFFGTLGILLQAKERNLVPAVKPLAEQLLAFGFHADKELIGRVLQSAGEK